MVIATRPLIIIMRILIIIIIIIKTITIFKSFDLN